MCCRCVLQYHALSDCSPCIPHTTTHKVQLAVLESRLSPVSTDTPFLRTCHAWSLRAGCHSHKDHIDRQAGLSGNTCSLLPCCLTEHSHRHISQVTTACLYSLQAFDALLFLQRGGTTLYCGPLGQNAQDLIFYFENLGVDRISPGYNAATWMLENTTVLVEEKKKISFSDAFHESDLRR